MFDEFTPLVKRVFAIRIVEPFCIPILLKFPPRDYLESTAATAIINALDGMKSLLEIALSTKLVVEIVAYEILELMDKGFIGIKFKCKPTDIFRITRRGIHVLNTPSSMSNIPATLSLGTVLKILSEIDGVRTANDIANELKLPFITFSEYIKFLYREGLIEYIPLYHLAVLILRDTLNLLLVNSLKYLGKSKAADIFELAKEEAKKIYAKIESVELTNNMKIEFGPLQRYMVTGSMEDVTLIIKALAMLISVLRQKIRDFVGDKVDTAINNNVNAQITSKYSITYTDVLIAIGIDVKSR